MPTMSSPAWIVDELPGRSPVRAPPAAPRKASPGGSVRRMQPDGSLDGGDAFSNISNGQPDGGGGSGRSGVRRIGDIFRARLRMAGAAAMRTFNDSFPQECKVHSDEESGVQTPSPNTPKGGPPGRRTFDALDAVLVNERAVAAGAGGAARRERTFTERSNTLAGAGPNGGLRSRRSSTMFRQRTVHRTSSGVNQRAVGDGTDGAVANDDGADYGGHQHQQQQQQQPRNDTTQTKPDDATPVEPRDIHRPPGQSAIAPGMLARGAKRHPDGLRAHTSGVPAGSRALEPADEEVVVGKPPSRERVNSTSHYSTEKSGSSGYYSTNLYSTGGSSVDEHIYCEPIDRCPRTARLDVDGGGRGGQAGAVPAKVRPAVVGGEEPAALAPANCDRKRPRGSNEQDLHQDRQRNVRGLEQYYYPASLASPAAPVQLTVLRASVAQKQALGGTGGLQQAGVGGPDCGRELSCANSDDQQQQQQQQQHEGQEQEEEHHSDPPEQPLSVIMEGIDGQIPRPIWPLDTDDSLMDINLESFRMAQHSSQNLIGFESPLSLSSLTDNEMYAGRIAGPGHEANASGANGPTGPQGESKGHSRKKSQYEEYLEFHNTRNILEQIRGKLNTLLEQRAEQQQQQQQQQQVPADPPQRIAGNPFANSTLVTSVSVPPPPASETELEKNIAILKADLDGYLRTMNQKNENEIKRFCRGMSREPKVVAVQNAVEQRNRSRSGSIMSLEHDYELLDRSLGGGAGGGVPYGSVASCGSESQLPYYQVMPPREETADGGRHYPTGRPPAALPAAAALVLNRRSPPNPFAQEVRSCALFQHGMGQPSGGSSVGGLHSLCCQQRYLNSDEIRICSRYGGCDRKGTGSHRNVAIDMPEDDDDDDGGDAGSQSRGSASDDDDDESFVGVSAGRGSVRIGMPPLDAGPSAAGEGRRGARVKIQSDPVGDGGSVAGGCFEHGSNGGGGASDCSAAGRGAMGGHCDFSQLQRNITLERIILMESLGKSRTGQFGDKEKMLLEWHQNKPSCWELYYGANREEQKPHQTLIRKMKLGRKSTVCISYPSTRPESDFTLDVPRAEQLRLKMKKEKQFRSRCRWFFYFLSVVFFLLSVMVVSLILTRGKRMFGSMI